MLTTPLIATAPIAVLGLTSECAVCHRYFCDDDIAESIDDGHGSIGHICDACAQEAEESSKFEDPMTMILWSWMMDGSYGDDSMSNGEDWAERFGCFVLYGDSRGFVGSNEYRNVTAAEKAFQEAHDDGMGAQEYDYFITETSRGYEVTDANGYQTFPRLTRARAFYRMLSTKEGYWPNLWFVSERGSIRRIDY